MVRARGLSDEARRAAEAAARRSYGKLVALLAARTRDVPAAEDALADAFAAALADWPANGCPANPEAWLFAVARRRAIDAGRRRATSEAAAAQLRALADSMAGSEEASFPDQRLALMFACAHPALEPAVRAPLVLQVVLGLDAATIAASFLVAPAAMGKRLVRAKQKIREAGVPFRIPEPDELAPRLDAVLEAIYAAFTEGWSDGSGSDARRRDLTGEALYLARLVTELMPEAPEPLGLLALMLHAEARRPARRDADGAFVPLAQQDPAAWSLPLIRQAESLLRRAAAFAAPGRYQLEAALQSAHVHRRLSGEPNWTEVVALYDALLAVAPSPVVALNRAVALAERDGAPAALALVDCLEDRLRDYQPYWAARADLLFRAGRRAEARAAYASAIGLERDPAVRAFLERRRDACVLLDARRPASESGG